MKKGKIAFTLAGIFDIILGLFLITTSIVILLGVLGVLNSVNFFYPLIESALYLVFTAFNLTINSYQAFIYIYLGLNLIIGIFILLFGIFTLRKIKIEEHLYYEKGRKFVRYAVFNTIFLLFFLANAIAYILTSTSILNAMILLIIYAVLGFSVISRYIGLNLFYSGRKQFFLKEKTSKQTKKQKSK